MRGLDRLGAGLYGLFAAFGIAFATHAGFLSSFCLGVGFVGLGVSIARSGGES